MPGFGVGGRGQCRVGLLALAVGVDAGLVLLALAVGVNAGLVLLALAVGVDAGLLLSALVVCVSRIFSLSLLATVRGGTSFLCPKRQRNEAKKTLSPLYPKCPQRAVFIHRCPKSTVLARAKDV